LVFNSDISNSQYILFKTAYALLFASAMSLKVVTCLLTLEMKPSKLPVPYWIANSVPFSLKVFDLEES
jgi:hypothetical protein